MSSENVNKEPEKEGQEKGENSQNQQPKEEPKNEQSETKNVEKQINQMSLQESSSPEQSPKQQQRDSKVQSQNGSESPQLYETKYFVDMSRTNIVFGKNTLFPGSIEEVDVSIALKEDILDDNGSANPYMLRVIAKCSNEEFNDLDEYVFSVRSNERFEYFEEVRFKIRKKERAQVKVAVKIPPVKENHVIEGVLQIQLENLQPVLLPICAKCEVPQICCVKDLYKPEQDTQVIKVPAKKNQIRMPPIPFKNLSNFNFTLEVEAISNQNFSNRPFDIVTQNFVNCQANTQFFVNIQLKENMQYKGPTPTRDTIRKILILKIKNSSVYYNYPLEVQVFEGSNQSGMS